MAVFKVFTLMRYIGTKSDDQVEGQSNLKGIPAIFTFEIDFRFHANHIDFAGFTRLQREFF